MVWMFVYPVFVYPFTCRRTFGFCPVEVIMNRFAISIYVQMFVLSETGGKAISVIKWQKLG